MALNPIKKWKTVVLQPTEQKRRPREPEIIEVTAKEALKWEAGLTDGLHVLELSLEHREGFENKLKTLHWPLGEVHR